MYSRVCHDFLVCNVGGNGAEEFAGHRGWGRYVAHCVDGDLSVLKIKEVEGAVVSWREWRREREKGTIRNLI